MNNDQPNLGAPADAGTGSAESSDSALGASVAKAATESDGTKSLVPAPVTPEPRWRLPSDPTMPDIVLRDPPVFGGQFQDVKASDTVSEGETRNYTDEAGVVTPAEIVHSNTDGTVDILVQAGVARIRRDNVPWKKEGMKGNFVE